MSTKPLTVSLCFFAGISTVSLSAHAQSVDGLRNVIGRVCPADLSPYRMIDGNAACNPEARNTKACDQKFAPASQPWMACYDEVEHCRAGVLEQNKTISAYNAWVSKCKHSDDTAHGKDAPPAPVRNVPGKVGNSGGQPDIGKRIEAQKSKNQTKALELQLGRGEDLVGKELKEEREQLEADLKRNKENQDRVRKGADLAMKGRPLPFSIAWRLTGAEALDYMQSIDDEDGATNGSEYRCSETDAGVACLFDPLYDKRHLGKCFLTPTSSGRYKLSKGALAGRHIDIFCIRRSANVPD